MICELVRGRHPASVDELDALERQQLYLAGVAFDGMARPVELRFTQLPRGNPYDADADDDDDDDDDGWWDDGCLVLHMLSGWDVWVDGVHRYDLWLHHVDAGSLFVAGTTEMVAGRVQSTWLMPDVMTPWPEAPELDAAMKRAGVW
jgi:hypothetical protein